MLTIFCWSSASLGLWTEDQRVQDQVSDRNLRVQDQNQDQDLANLVWTPVSCLETRGLDHNTGTQALTVDNNKRQVITR